jgi:hypothetical protein
MWETLGCPLYDYQSYINILCFWTQGKKLGDVHKIIRIPEETGGIHKKVGPFQCGFHLLLKILTKIKIYDIFIT